MPSTPVAACSAARPDRLPQHPPNSPRRRSRAAAATLLAVLVTAASSRAATTAPALQIANPELFGKSVAAASEAIEHYGAWDDAAAMQRVADIGYRIAAVAGFDKYPLAFFLVDMREPNAFALPGGQVFVTRGMLDLGLDDDALAALLGHEIAHVTLEHGIKMQRRAALLNALSSAVMVGVILGARGGSDVPSDVPLYGPGPERRGTSSAERIQGAVAASLILSELLLRSYSREFEDQADEEGQRLAAAAGFAPTGGEHLFGIMEERLPQSREYGYWRTHPFYEERVGAAAARGRLLRAQEPRPAEGYRVAAQETLLAYEPKEAKGQEARAADLERIERLLESAALTAWPQGATAERLRREDLERLRDAELADAELARDYGRVIRAYEAEMAEVRALTPESPLLAVLQTEVAALRQQADALRGKADEVVAAGVYQTECGPMDLTGAELRDGEYELVDGADFVEMRLER